MTTTPAPRTEPSTQMPTWRTTVPVAIAVTLLLGVAYAGLWALRDLVSLGVWFLGAQ